MPYSSITDGTRWVAKPTTHSNLETMLADAAISYRRALWHDQAANVHLFTEKDAISGVVLPVTEQWDVPLGIMRGYCSESFAHTIAETVMAAGKPTFIYQLGDHDPSGVDAWRDFREKVTGFLGEPVTPELAAAARKIGGVDLTVGVAFGVDDGADAPDHWNPDDDVWMQLDHVPLPRRPRLPRRGPAHVDLRAARRPPRADRADAAADSTDQAHRQPLGRFHRRVRGGRRHPAHDVAGDRRQRHHRPYRPRGAAAAPTCRRARAPGLRALAGGGW